MSVNPVLLNAVWTVVAHLAVLFLAWKAGDGIAYFMGFRRGLEEGRDDAISHHELRLPAEESGPIDPPTPP